MPTYMDRHDNVEITPEELAGAHVDGPRRAGEARRELPELLVRPARRTACSASSTRPSKEAAEAVHREAHGEIASKIIEVEGHAVMSFLGPIPAHPSGEAYVETAFRTILFTDIVGSTDMTQRLGDAGDGARPRARSDRARPSSLQAAATR